jgi:glycosyltransferase involved in cell wall biosynthesis
VALRARLFGKPVILTYHCDLQMPPGSFNRLVNMIVNVQNNLAALWANHVITYTQDYADHSSFLTRYHSKLTPMLPPVVIPTAEPRDVEAFASMYAVNKRQPVIGMVTRFAAEKGVEVLLEALPTVLEKYPNAQVLFAGQYQNVMGEQSYAERLMPLIRKYEEGGYWKFLGNLSQLQLAAFYPNLDVLVVPSLNSTEAFGLVQVEAMMNGVPCVASALPGVRRPVQMHGMGKVTAIGDPYKLAEALLEILAKKHEYRCDSAELRHLYDPDTIAAEYEMLFEKSLMEKSTRRNARHTIADK